MTHAQHPLVIKAIGICGSEAKLAAATGVSQPAIHKAKNAARVSAELALRIERATNGEIQRWQLRPDLWDAPKQGAAA